MPHRLRPLLAILVLGAFSQIAQAVLIREALVVFYGNEASLGAFYGSWLLVAGGRVPGGAAVGSRSRPRRGPGGGLAPACGACCSSCPWRWPARCWPCARSGSFWMSPPVQLVPLGELLVSLTLVTLPVGVLLGLAFPLVCRALEGDRRA